MSIKINKLEIENVKRIKAVKIEPSANGLTIVGGKPPFWIPLPGRWEETDTVHPRQKIKSP